MPHMATALEPAGSWGWAFACFAFIMASASHSCATLQPCSQHNLQTHWAMILLGKNSSNMSCKPTQCPKNLISSVSTLLQILLQAVGSRELLLLFPSGGSSPNSTWALSGQNTAMVPCKYSNLAAFDTKFIIKNYFC